MKTNKNQTMKRGWGGVPPDDDDIPMTSVRPAPSPEDFSRLLLHTLNMRCPGGPVMAWVERRQGAYSDLNKDWSRRETSYRAMLDLLCWQESGNEHQILQWLERRYEARRQPRQ